MATSLGSAIAVHSEEQALLFLGLFRAAVVLGSWGPGSPSSSSPRLIPGEEKLICWVDVTRALGF